MITDLDIRFLTFVQEHLRTAAATPFWKFITLFGDAGIFWIRLTLILLLWKRTRKAGLACTISLVLDFLIVNILIKNLVARPRPYDLFQHITSLVGEMSDFSYPSGHTAASFACSLVLVRMLPKKYGVPLVVLSCLIAFSRLYLGVHYPTDVIGGFLIGCLTSWIACRVVQKKLQRDDKSSYSIIEKTVK